MDDGREKEKEKEKKGVCLGWGRYDIKRSCSVIRERKIDVLSFGLIICGVFMFYLCSVEALALVNQWPNEPNQLGRIDLG